MNTETLDIVKKLIKGIETDKGYLVVSPLKDEKKVAFKYIDVELNKYNQRLKNTNNPWRLPYRYELSLIHKLNDALPETHHLRPDIGYWVKDDVPNKKKVRSHLRPVRIMAEEECELVAETYKNLVNHISTEVVKKFKEKIVS